MPNTSVAQGRREWLNRCHSAIIEKAADDAGNLVLKTYNVADTPQFAHMPTLPGHPMAVNIFKQLDVFHNDVRCPEDVVPGAYVAPKKIRGVGWYNRRCAIVLHVGK